MEFTIISALIPDALSWVLFGLSALGFLYTMDAVHNSAPGALINIYEVAAAWRWSHFGCWLGGLLFSALVGVWILFFVTLIIGGIYLLMSFPPRGSE